MERGYTGAVSGDSRVNGLKKLQRILARNSHLERLNLLRGLNCKNSSYEFVYKRNELFIEKRWPSDRIAKRPSKILIIHSAADGGVCVQPHFDVFLNSLPCLH